MLFYINLYRKEYKKQFFAASETHPKHEAKEIAVRKAAPIKALLAVMGCVVIFWAIFHQNGSALTIWAENYTHREVPGSLEGIVTKLSFNQVVTTGENNAHADPYFDNVPKEKWPASGKSNLFSTELFQSVNPFSIILFTPLVVGFFNYRRRIGKQF
ncbi:MAG: peptide MFS transporter [Bacteroidales bacterium]|nr:peptide MFS transporter [Bacteroidales bacterium]